MNRIYTAIQLSDSEHCLLHHAHIQAYFTWNSQAVNLLGTDQFRRYLTSAVVQELKI